MRELIGDPGWLPGSCRDRPVCVRRAGGPGGHQKEPSGAQL